MKTQYSLLSKIIVTEAVMTKHRVLDIGAWQRIEAGITNYIINNEITEGIEGIDATLFYVTNSTIDF